MLKVNATISDNQALGTITNDDAVPTASIAVAPSSVLEDGTANLVYTVTLDHASAFDTTINYSVGGTATEGSDYTGTAVHSITILAGQLTGTITVDPTADTTVEYPDGAQAGAKAVAAAVPGASLVETGSVHKVTLVLGANGVQAKALRTGQSTQPSQSAQSSQSQQPAKHAAAPPSGQPACIN